MSALNEGGHLHGLSTCIVGKETLVHMGWASAVTQIKVQTEVTTPLEKLVPL
jgi:hypothetical protein